MPKPGAGKCGYVAPGCASDSFREQTTRSALTERRARAVILVCVEDRGFRDVGGTPGGLGEFLLGVVMTCVGGYLLTNQVTVAGSYWSFYGAETFGVTLVPMLFGIALIFWNGRSIAGWALTLGGALIILAGVIANLHIYFRPATLFNTIVMLVLVVGGLGLIARSMRPHGTSD